MSTPSTASLLSSDVALILLFPLTLMFLLLRLLPFSLRDILSSIIRTTPITQNASGQFSLARAHNSYTRYPQMASHELARMRTAYGRLGRADRGVGWRVGYDAKLDLVRGAIKGNAKVTGAIAAMASHISEGSEGSGVPGADLGRVREALKHFVRDWSEDGRAERERMFGLILGVLRADTEGRERGKRVLVPGAGLGRLAWEISQLGYETTANELSSFMTLAFRFLLSEENTPHTNMHSIQPYAHWFSHQRKNLNTFRSISFPDVLPRLSSSLLLAETDFLTLTGQYDYVVTLFFIDTSLNAIATIRHIHSLLKPGTGKWINLGPLLWTGGAQAGVEFSLEEVLAVVKEVGFELEGESVSVECEYTADSEAMMRWLYQAEFWTARKL